MRSDSKLVYVLCHAMSVAYHLALFAGSGYVAIKIGSVWPIVAAALFGRTYHHDFNKESKKEEGK